MRHKQKDIDEKREQGDQKRRKQENEERQKISRRMGRGVEMGGSGHTQADQSEEGSDGMDDQDGREGFSSTRGKIEVIAIARRH